jgi:hypothetical protein
MSTGALVFCPDCGRCGGSHEGRERGRALQQLGAAVYARVAGALTGP